MPNLHRIRRITADWDFKNKIKICFYLLRCLKLLGKSKQEKLIIKRSHSKGFHVILWSRSYGKIFDLRKYIGDDKKHLAMDKLHKNGRQTLFFKKKKYRKQ